MFVSWLHRLLREKMTAMQSQSQRPSSCLLSFYTICRPFTIVRSCSIEPVRDPVRSPTAVLFCSALVNRSETASLCFSRDSSVKFEAFLLVGSVTDDGIQMSWHPLSIIRRFWPPYQTPRDRGANHASGLGSVLRLPPPSYTHDCAQ